MFHQRDKKIKILIAGSWTGGHLFPGISICQEMKKKWENLEVFFVTSKKGPAPDILKRYGYKSIFLEVSGIKGKGIKGTASILKLPLSFIRALKLIRDISPSVILGLGGSLSGPICITGKLIGIPTAIHEQNILPGFTNRILYHFVDKVFVSFKETLDLMKGKHVFFTGNPVRQEFFSIKKDKQGIFTILVIGGSQGSYAINHAFLDSLHVLIREGKTINVIHQTGMIDFEHIKKRYKELGLKAHVTPFIENMPSAMKKADLVISRAGASTIFELSASGTPSILIPYPYAADQHQEKNALSLVRVGGAEIIYQDELTGKRLAKVIKKYMNNPKILEEMSESVRVIARPDAAKVIVEHIIRMIKI